MGKNLYRGNLFVHNVFTFHFIYKTRTCLYQIVKSYLKNMYYCVRAKNRKLPLPKFVLSMLNIDLPLFLYYNYYK